MIEVTIATSDHTVTTMQTDDPAEALTFFRSADPAAYTHIDIHHSFPEGQGADVLVAWLEMNTRTQTPHTPK